MFHRKQLAGAGKTGLHFIGNHHNAVLVANLAHRAHKFRRTHIKTALALYRLENNRRHILRRNITFEDAFDAFYRFFYADILGFGRKQAVVHPRRHRAEIGLIRQHFAGERQRHHGAAVECAAKRNHTVALGRRACDFHRIFHRFGTAGEKLAFHLAGNRHQAVDALGQFDVAVIRHDLKRGVAELLQLRFHRRHHFRMAVAGVQHADAAGKIDKFTPVGGFDHRILRTFGKPVAHHAGAVGNRFPHSF